MNLISSGEIRALVLNHPIVGVQYGQEGMKVRLGYSDGSAIFSILDANPLRQLDEVILHTVQIFDYGRLLLWILKDAH